jgi:hypothetical protein
MTAIETVPVLAFTKDPRHVGVADAMSIVLGFVRATWRIWLPFAVAYGVLWAAVYAAGFDLELDRPVGAPPSDRIPFAFFVNLPSTIVRDAVTLLLTALALASVRGRTADRAWLIRVIPRALATQVVMVVAYGIGAEALSWVGTDRSRLVLEFAILVPLYIGSYVTFRLFFWQVAILDGASIADGLRTSWRLSRKSVLRILGWSMVFGLPLVILPFGVEGILRQHLGAVGAGLQETLSTAWLAVSAGMTTVLYESERWRKDAPASAPAVVEPGAESIA